MQRDRCHVIQPFAKEGYVLMISITKNRADNYIVDIDKTLCPEKFTHSRET